MKEKTQSELIQYLRGVIQHSHETVARLKLEGKDSLYSLGKGSVANDVLHFLNAKPEADAGLVLECETLIPKGAYWAGHELNRGLHHYKKYALENDWLQFVNSEYELRRALLKARQEVYGRITSEKL